MATGASSEVFDQISGEYLEPILADIRVQALKKAGGGELRATDVFRALEEHFATLPRRHRSPTEFIQDNVFLLSAMFLTIIFGAFGLYHGDESEVSSFLDIAKIFAGAVVGGAAGSSVAAMSRRRSGAAAK
ncbi:hypothetical protein [Allosphingosinicella sp.]|jgi:hypothetical protein|uniref:hypothetical protein n=1 Tax=Allosphingosinicella sp. TaxID=2823234 RepID=UPI002EEC6D22